MFNSCKDFQVSLDIYKLNTQTKPCPHQLNNFTNVIKAIYYTHKLTYHCI